MNKNNNENNKSHNERVCMLHGICSRDPKHYPSHHITLFGLDCMNKGKIQKHS